MITTILIGALLSLCVTKPLIFPKKKSPVPDKNTLVITEEDRQRADDYSSNETCLIATAFKRQFPKLHLWCVTPDYIRFGYRLGGETYYVRFNAKEDVVKYQNYKEVRPFYNPSVVGHVIHLSEPTPTR